MAEQFKLGDYVRSKKNDRIAGLIEAAVGAGEKGAHQTSYAYKVGDHWLPWDDVERYSQTEAFKIGDTVETFDRALWSNGPARGLVTGFDDIRPGRVIVRFNGGSQRAPMLPHEIRKVGP